MLGSPRGVLVGSARGPVTTYCPPGRVNYIVCALRCGWYICKTTRPDSKMYLGFSCLSFKGSALFVWCCCSRASGGLVRNPLPAQEVQGSVPGLGRCSEEAWQPAPVFLLLENPMGRGVRSQFMGCKRLRRDLMTKQQEFFSIYSQINFVIFKTFTDVKWRKGTGGKAPPVQEWHYPRERERFHLILKITESPHPRIPPGCLVPKQKCILLNG